MHDARAGLLLEEALRQEPDQIVPLDELPALIEEEAAVVVPVPGETDVRAGATHHIGGGGAVFLPHRVRHPVREGAVGLVVHLDELEPPVPRPAPLQGAPPPPSRGCAPPLLLPRRAGPPSSAAAPRTFPAPPAAL